MGSANCALMRSKRRFHRVEPRLGAEELCELKAQKSAPFGVNLMCPKQTCSGMTPKEYTKYTLERMCQEHKITLESAQAACIHLQGDPSFFKDCQLDFCAADGNPDAVAGAEAEEHAENPQPVCAVANEACNPATACCNALKDEATLNFGSIVQNNLCGDDDGAQELRYGSVLTQQGVSMDLVITPVDHDCGRATNDKNGAKTEALGIVAVQTGREAT